MFSLISVFCFCSLCSPGFVPFFCSPYCFLWGAEDNTAVFLYINSCTLKTIQLLMNLHLCGLVFSFSVVLQSLTNVCSFLKCLFASPGFFSISCFLFQAGPTPTGMAHFFFLLLLLVHESCCCTLAWAASNYSPVRLPHSRMSIRLK